MAITLHFVSLSICNRPWRQLLMLCLGCPVQVLRVFVLGRITPEALRQQVQAQLAARKPPARDRSSVAGALPGSGTGSLNSSMRTPGAAASLKPGQSGAQAAPDATAKGALSKTATGTTPLNSARGQAGDKNATTGSKGATGKLEATSASAPGDTPGDAGDQVTTSATGMSLEDALLSSSNLYSTSECCLLAWLGHNLALAFPQLVGVQHGEGGDGPGLGAQHKAPHAKCVYGVAAASPQPTGYMWICWMLSAVWWRVCCL
jgi:hypothetical protein